MALTGECTYCGPVSGDEIEHRYPEQAACSKCGQPSVMHVTGCPE